MKMAKEEKKKPVKKNQAILTAFILIFPIFIIAAIAITNLPGWIIALCLFFYEAILIKNFIDDHYAKE